MCCQCWVNLQLHVYCLQWYKGFVQVASNMALCRRSVAFPLLSKRSLVLEPLPIASHARNLFAVVVWHRVLS